MELNSLLEYFYKSVKVGIQITDRDGTIVKLNDACCNIFGFPQQELTGKNFTSVLSPENREPALEYYKNQFTQASTVSPLQHWSVQQKSGRRIMVSFNLFTLYPSGEDHYGISIVKELKQSIPAETFFHLPDNEENGVLLTDQTGALLHWNPAGASLFKLEDEKSHGLPVSNFIPELKAEELDFFFGKSQSPFFLFNQQINGSQQFLDIEVFLLPPEQGKTSGFYIKALEPGRKLRKSLALWPGTSGTTLSALIRLDQKGQLLYSNDSFQSLTGKRHKDKQSDFQNFIHPGDRDLWTEKYPQLQEVQGLQTLELRVLKEDGRSAWMSWEFGVLHNSNGKPAGLQGVGTDISQQKKLSQERDNLLFRMQAMNEELQANEEELRQNLEKTVELNQYILKNERKFKSLLENSFEAVILYDEPGYITYASPSVSSTLGYSSEEMQGRKGMAFIHEEDKARTRELLAQMMEKPGNRVYILQRVRRKDGRYIWTESFNVNLLHDENVKGIVSNFRDVTERIQAEEKIRDSEASLNLAQHIASLGSAEFDLKTGKVKHSSGVFAIYDFDLDTFTEEEFNGFEYLHPEDVEKASEFFNNYKPTGPEWIKGLADLSEETIKEAEAAPFEFRIVSAMGRLKYLRTRNRFVRNKEGKPVKSIITIQDISEEKERRRLLDETGRIARTGGWQLDLQTNTVSWTEQTYQLFEIPTTEELSIEKATQFYLPDYQPILMEAFQKLVSEGTPFDLELKMATATKKEVWVRMLGQAETANNKVVLVKGTMQDITSRKNAEHEIRRYSQRLQLATEAAGIGIWDWDLQTNEMVWDQHMRELYAISPEKEKVDYNDYRKALHPDDVHEQEELLQRVFKDKKLESEFRIIIHSEVKWIKSYAKIFTDEEGRASRMVGLNWDISQLKKTEEMLRKNNEELLKINHELDQFVYSTSHNLRAPLTSVLGVLNLIKNYPEGADIQTYLNLIEKSVIKLDETIQEISDYSRNTRVEVILEPVNFEAIIEGVIESLSFLEQAEKINISYVTPEGSRFLSDSSRLKMIFTNLISNAIKYACAEEEAPSIFISIEDTPEGISIRIKDNGIGIAREHQEKIFSMFFRASSKSTGSGLGLYIVKEAVHKMGGTIRVESTPGEGTEFILFLPDPQ